MAPAVVGAVLRELQARNAAERGAFEGVVGEYMAVLERCHVLEVRVGGCPPPSRASHCVLPPAGGEGGTRGASVVTAEGAPPPQPAAHSLCR